MSASAASCRRGPHAFPPMASNAHIDVEDATQHLRDILKLDRTGSGAGTAPAGSQKTSFNGDLNGLFGSGILIPDEGVTCPPAKTMSAQDRQIIHLSGDDRSIGIAISSNDVEIVASHDSNIKSEARSSNKVKIQPMANYDWEHKYYYGNLIAVSNSYLAYVIRGHNSSAMIRVLSVNAAERALLKGFAGVVADLAFSHLDSDQLACVDEAGGLFVWQLSSRGGKIRDEIIVHVLRPSDTPLNPNRRLIWCPFIPEEGEVGPEEMFQTLALLHEDRAEVWDLDILTASQSSWPADSAALTDGFITVRGHRAPISEGALSPDGAILATASHDGYLKFWQIYIEGPNSPRCLLEWKPHDGRPLSCLLFCDNHKQQDPEVPFWRFLITGADQSSELKMWCTVSWTCLQTIRFSPDPFSSPIIPSLKVSLDLTATYLVLTDVQRKVLYVMELAQDLERGHAHFSAISEFLLAHPVLSFGVLDTSRRRAPDSEGLPLDEESESATNDGGQGALEAKTGVQIKLYCIHTKSLQDVQIWFQPHLGPGNSQFPSPANTQAGLGYVLEAGAEGLCSDTGARIPALPSPADFLSPAGDTKPKLMTPDAFMTPSASIPASPCGSGSNLTLMTAITNNPVRGVEEPSQSPSSLSLSSTVPLGVGLSPIPRPSMLLIPGLGDQLPTNTIQTAPNPPLEPLLASQASPTRERSPDVISSASAAAPQDAPAVASETLPREAAAHPAGAARTHGHRDAEQEGSGISTDTPASLPWPAAPDITRETCGSLRDGGLLDRSTEEMKDKQKSSPYRRRPYSLARNDSQGGSTEQSDHDDEVASPTSFSGNCGSQSTCRLPGKDWKMSPRGPDKLRRQALKEAGDSSQSRRKESQVSMDLLQEVLRSQQREIAELRQGQLELQQLLMGSADGLQSSILRHIEIVTVTRQEQDQLRMELVLAAEQQEARLVQDHLSEQLVQALGSTLSGRLERLLREEMRRTLPHTISSSLEPLSAQLSTAVSSKLTSVEGTLKENVVRVTKSKNTTEAIGRAAAEVLQGPIQASYRDTFDSVVLPLFEKGCQSMFLQINDSFRQGTQEYIQQLESQARSRRQRERERDARDPLLVHLQHVIGAFHGCSSRLGSATLAGVRAEIQHQLHTLVGNLQDSILVQVQRAVKGEVSQAVKEQQAVVTCSIMQAMRSAAGSPAPPAPPAQVDYQAQQASVLLLLQQGFINQAFQQALSAADLDLVLYVCETVDSQLVFGRPPCPLIQPVLLSLIQQLSTNLATRSELKISYLEEALLNLDHSDPVTRDHMSSVLTQVRQKLFQFLQLELHSPLGMRARRLLLMLQGLLLH
nr:enhancer of mRNA-decapping protein 4-like isoform X2 [Paramormyrops kingsleyae]